MAYKSSTIYSMKRALLPVILAAALAAGCADTTYTAPPGRQQDPAAAAAVYGSNPPPAWQDSSTAGVQPVTVAPQPATSALASAALPDSSDIPHTPDSALPTADGQPQDAQADNAHNVYVNDPGSDTGLLGDVTVAPEQVIAEFERLVNTFDVKPDDWAAIIVVDTQRLWIVNRGGVAGTHPVSTGKGGISNAAGSNGTPLGAHQISWVVRGATGTVVRGFGPTGRTAGTTTAYMTTRAFGLVGLEPHNRSSASRGIFLHGTNMPHQLGAPRSGGCIRVEDTVALLLDDLLPDNAAVSIIG